MSSIAYEMKKIIHNMTIEELKENISCRQHAEWKLRYSCIPYSIISSKIAINRYMIKLLEKRLEELND